MYFAMDDIGDENIDALAKLTTSASRWQYIDKIANVMGFDGIQVTNSSFYKRFGIPLDKLPKHMKKYKLTYHVGGLYDLSEDGIADKYVQEIRKGFYSAIENDMEDVSIHPPFLPLASHVYRDEVTKKFAAILDDWIPKFVREGITLSVETHVGGNTFLFNRLERFADFIAAYTYLGVLIDVSHNVNDGRSVNEILQSLKRLSITGLHLSDAVPNVEIKKGTHLPIGYGEINFWDLLQPFVKKDIYGALEIKSTGKNIFESVQKLRKTVHLIEQT